MMKSTLLQKLHTLAERYAEISGLLADPDVIQDQQRYRALTKEYAQLDALVQCFYTYQKNTESLEAIQQMLQEEEDQPLKQLAAEELDTLFEQKAALESELQQLLLPEDPDDGRNVFIEIRAGAGGDEAAVFAGDLFRMYMRYAETQRWKLQVVASHQSDQGGFKYITASVAGDQVYAQLKFESGVHRVQRVPVTESQGRVHTSTCTVAIMPEVESIDAIDILPTDLRIDTYRASGAGGQHVNRTDSAVRITHLPTGLVVECQDERSQHKNKAHALSLLKAKLLSEERHKQAEAQAQKKRLLVGTGDRSERIRTYNYPQGRVTDHRINLTLYQLETIINGDLEWIIESLSRELRAQQLAELGDH